MRRRHTAPRPWETPGSAMEAAEAGLAVDFPREGEAIAAGAYSLRVSAPDGAEAAEVSINKGPWLACRRDAGFWWYDWAGVEPGSYQVRARARLPDGSLRLTLLRRFLAASCP